MPLTVDRIYTTDGAPCRGFFVRNRAGKALAIGADTMMDGTVGFVMPSRKRYARDVSLCRALTKLTGEPVKWNLFLWSEGISSHGLKQAQECNERMGSRR